MNTQQPKDLKEVMLDVALDLCEKNLKPKKPPTERAEQRWYVSWFYKQYPQYKLAKFFNDGVRSPEQGRLMAFEGLLVGMVDLVVLVPRKPFHGLYIEFKRIKGGKVSGEQAAVIEYLNIMGYKAAVCYGWYEARILTEEYMAGEVWQ